MGLLLGTSVLGVRASRRLPGSRKECRLPLHEHYDAPPSMSDCSLGIHPASVRRRATQPAALQQRLLDGEALGEICRTAAAPQVKWIRSERPATSARRAERSSVSCGSTSQTSAGILNPRLRLGHRSFTVYIDFLDHT